jgi:hypothetical protein
LGWGWLTYAALAAGFGFADAAWHAWALFLAMGLVIGFIEGPERALVARLGGGRQGSAFGAYHGAQGFAALAGGLGMGLLYQLAGPLVACLASAGGVLVVRAAWRGDTKS